MSTLHDDGRRAIDENAVHDVLAEVTRGVEAETAARAKEREARQRKIDDDYNARWGAPGSLRRAYVDNVIKARESVNVTEFDHDFMAELDRRDHEEHVDRARVTVRVQRGPRVRARRRSPRRRIARGTSKSDDSDGSGARSGSVS